ncbi:MAG: hypothetical protein ACRDLS_06850 [Solirubrobacteraceae bacterium]
MFANLIDKTTRRAQRAAAYAKAFALLEDTPARPAWRRAEASRLPPRRPGSVLPTEQPCTTPRRAGVTTRRAAHRAARQ